MDPDPFPGLLVDSYEFLDGLDGRSTCPKCGKSRKYYCYTCYVPVQGIEDRVPKIKLPIKVDIIKHPSECDGKSTAAHAGVLAPEYVTVYTYPVIPDYTDKDKVLLVFPGDQSKSIEELAKACGRKTSKCHPQTATPDVRESGEPVPLTPTGCEEDSKTQAPQPHVSQTESCAENINGNKRPADTEGGEGDVKRRRSEGANEENEETGGVEEIAEEAKRVEEEDPPFERVVFIDSTWNQTKKIFMDERLTGLQQIELKTQSTRFWRHQRDKPRSYLATIEAIYFFLRDYHEHFISRRYGGEYDNLLFFFCFMYHKIRGLYDGGKKLKAYEQAKQQRRNSQSEPHQLNSKPPECRS